MNLAETMNNTGGKGMSGDMNSPFSNPGSIYITEKLYMLLQLYLQNKGWNPSAELLQCFTELKDSSMLPSGAHLQVLASRIALDSQGRLILRENGKIILPYEHFANAIMLKHMNGPHGLHLSLEATVRAVCESYTIGRENFGMEKEFILDVVQNCPSATCRFYKAQLDITQPHSKPTYIPEVQPPVPASLSISALPATGSNESSFLSMAPPPQLPPSVSSTPPSQPSSRPSSGPPSRPPSVDLTSSFESVVNGTSNSMNGKSHPQTPTNGAPSPPATSAPLPPPSPKPPPIPKPLTPRQQQHNKLADFLKANLENFDNGTSNKDEPSTSEDGKKQDAGQEKIVRAFSEIMKNMGRMKSCVRPAMCKPYGKQSEALQKTVIDTIQLVQSLRSFLPPPHIAVSSWKNEDKHSRLERKLNSNNLANNNNTGGSPSGSTSASTATTTIATTTTTMVSTPTSSSTSTNMITTMADDIGDGVQRVTKSN